MCTAIKRGLARGVTLVELIVFIVIVSIAVAGVLTALDIANRSSTDPMVQKQALAIAEALLEEVQLHPFTYCDPNDANAATALSSAGCTGGAGGANDENKLALGPEAGETRTGATPFDNVSDYNGFCMGPGCASPSVITDLSGSSIAGLEAYTASVTVGNQGFGPVAAPVPAADGLLISVTVTGPSNTTVVLHGYRTRYAPNAVP
jgi:MSHA pilin protein MshD